MICNNLTPPILDTFKDLNQEIFESIKHFPDSVRKEVRLLVKQYYVISIEQEDASILHYPDHERYFERPKIIQPQVRLEIKYAHTPHDENIFTWERIIKTI